MAKKPSVATTAAAAAPPPAPDPADTGVTLPSGAELPPVPPASDVFLQPGNADAAQPTPAQIEGSGNDPQPEGGQDQHGAAPDDPAQPNPLDNPPSDEPQPARDPLDHDGDGVKGGAVPAGALYSYDELQALYDKSEAERQGLVADINRMRQEASDRINEMQQLRADLAAANEYVNNYKRAVAANETLHGAIDNLPPTPGFEDAKPTRERGLEALAARVDELERENTTLRSENVGLKQKVDHWQAMAQRYRNVKDDAPPVPA